MLRCNAVRALPVWGDRKSIPHLEAAVREVEASGATNALGKIARESLEKLRAR